MRALVFDLDGTLLHFEEGYDEVLCDAIEHAGGDASEETLERLSETHAIGVLTNGVRSWQERKLEANGLETAVDAFVASYEVGAHKPAEEPFEELEDRLPATAYAMIGDSDSDVDGADAAGWSTYRYTGGGFGGLPDGLEWAEDGRP